MPTFTVSIDILADSPRVFAAVSDLTTHGQWSANPLAISAVDPGRVRIGSRFYSSAMVRGIPFQADLIITEYDPPRVFAFSGADSTAKFTHHFSIQPGVGGITHVARTVTLQTTFIQYLLFLARFRIIMLPSNREALDQLKAMIEKK